MANDSIDGVCYVFNNYVHYVRIKSTFTDDMNDDTRIWRKNESNISLSACVGVGYTLDDSAHGTTESNGHNIHCAFRCMDTDDAEPLDTFTHPRE